MIRHCPLPLPPCLRPLAPPLLMAALLALPPGRATAQPLERLATEGLASPAAVSLLEEAPRQLSTGDHVCYDPSVAAWGEDSLAAWTAVVDGRNRIVAARGGSHGWSEPGIVDNSTEGDCAQPVAAFSPSGEPYLLWIEPASSGTGSRLQLLRGQGAAADTVTRSTQWIESPSIAFRQHGRPIVAWVEGGAGEFRCQLGLGTTDGGWRILPLSSPSDSYDILPTVLAGSPPTVHWYSLGAESFQLRSAVVTESGWQSIQVPELEALPANRLPILYESDGSLAPGAVWVEPDPAGESVLVLDPRRLEGGVLSPDLIQLGGRQLEPNPARNAAEVTLAWREQGLDGQSEVLVRRGPRTLRVRGVDAIAQPRLAGDGRGGLHLLFVSNRADGGTGQVYSAYLPPADEE